tara:strand:+ start:1805 stop:2800 length:996 start_codon:yes stop_codon:yes gene_type:complete
MSFFNDSKKRNILITGGAGFVGYHLAKTLADENHNITIIDNFQRPNEDEMFLQLVSKDNVEHLKVDISSHDVYDNLEMNYYDVIYHFAALNGTANFYNHPEKVVKIGTLSTIYLLEWVAKHENRPKIIYTSSSETYAGTAKLLGENFPLPTPEDVPLTIDDVTNVRWSYGASKLLGEVAFYCYGQAHEITDFNVVRLHNIYGPRMGFEHVISQFIERYRNGERPLAVYGGSNTRSFCFITDVLAALSKITNEGIPREIYHIGNDKEEIRIDDLAKLLFEINEEKINIKVHEAPEGSVNRRCPNIDRLKSLGYENETSLKNGLKVTYDWYNR